MNILSKDRSFEQGKKYTVSETLKELFSQKKSINQDLQDFGLRTFHLENSIKKTWIENVLNKNRVDDDTYRCFLDLVSFIQNYELHDLTQLLSFYKKLRLDINSSLLQVNRTKRNQIEFLKNNLQYLLRDIKYLKEEIKKESLAFIINNAFHSTNRSSISETQKRDLFFFLRQFSSRLNSYEHFQGLIYELWSRETKQKMEEFKKIKEYL